MFEFTRRLILSGGISRKGFLFLFVYYLQLVCSLPFEWVQFLMFSRKINNTPITVDPVFILGHYRSGTSYLQKLLCSNNQFGFLSYYDALFPNVSLLSPHSIQRVIQWLIDLFKIKNPFFNHYLLKLAEPDEEDDYLMNRASAYSAYWGLIFPKKWREWLNCTDLTADPGYINGWKKEYLKTIQTITFKNKGKPLILKSPPNTARIRVLLDMFPDAKFVCISRNPEHLYYSVKHMWKNVILKFYSLQNISDSQLDEIIFGHFDFLTSRYNSEKHLIPHGNLIEITYEELKSGPWETVRYIYKQLQLPGFEKAADDLVRKIKEETGYKNFTYSFENSISPQIEKMRRKDDDLSNFNGLPRQTDQNKKDEM